MKLLIWNLASWAICCPRRDNVITHSFPLHLSWKIRVGKKFLQFWKTAHEIRPVIMPIKWKTAWAADTLNNARNRNMKLTSSQVEPFPDETMEIRQARFQSSFALLKNELHKTVLAAANGHRRKPKRENSSKQDVKWRHTHFLYWEKVMCTKRTTFHFECKWLNSRLCCCKMNDLHFNFNWKILYSTFPFTWSKGWKGDFDDCVIFQSRKSDLFLDLGWSPVVDFFMRLLFDHHF